MAVQNTVSSALNFRYGMCKYSAKLMLPVAHATNANAPATITVGTIARPSNPSVKFTALLEPTITK